MASKSCIDGECSQNLHFNDSFETNQPQWKPSMKPIDAGYGYEIPWKSSRSPVSGAGLSHLGTNAAMITTPEWSSSIRCFKPRSGSYTDRPKSTIPSVKPGHSSFYKWKPCVRIFEQKESVESTKLEQRRYIPCRSYTPPSWHPHRALGATRPQPESVPLFGSINPGVKVKSLRQRVESYFKAHPSIQLSASNGGSAKPSSESSATSWLESEERKTLRKSVNEYFGRHPQLHLFSSGVREAPDFSTRELFPPNRYIPEGHLDHFESGTNCMTKQNNVPARTECNMRKASSHELHPVTQRNVITGLLQQTDVIPPTKCAVVPTLLNPAGSFNKYVMENRFSGQEPQADRDCNECSSDQLIEYFASNSQAYENNRRHQTSVDAALKEHLYEVKQPICE